MPSKYEVVKEWRKQNPDKVAAQARRYRERHPNKIREIRDRHRENNQERIRELDREGQRRRRKADPEGARRRQQEFKARKEAERVALAGRPRPAACELCEEPSKVVFDHCHLHGIFRGWLCDRCNRVLGAVHDSPALLRKMIAYLETHSGTHHETAQ